jgi:hypothetical protein
MKSSTGKQVRNGPTKRGRGRPAKPENADRRALLVRLPAELYEDLSSLAAARDTYMADIIIDVLRTWLSKQPERRALERLRKASG